MQFVCQSLKCLEFLRGRTGGAAEDHQGYDPIGNIDFLQREGEYGSDQEDDPHWGKDVGTSGSRILGRSKCASDSTTPSTPKASDEQSSETRRKTAEDQDTAKPFSDDRDLFNELGMEAQYKSPKLIQVSSRHRTPNRNYASVSNILADSIDSGGGLDSWGDSGVVLEDTVNRGKTRGDE
eukprot:GHVS01030779.1.p2 GENE.GHVS01030779.1~~GHVS01030779.1.p2  ORF type:complete len:180 (+),score=22.38 GHVS01030779.1:143-682(+)